MTIYASHHTTYASTKAPSTGMVQADALRERQQQH